MPGPKHALIRERAIAALVEGKSLQDAAKSAKISRRTLHNWLTTDREFQAAFNAARRQLLDSALCLLQAASRGAVGALVKAAADVDPGVSIKGASALLDYVLRVDSYLTLESRVSALEKERKT